MRGAVVRLHQSFVCVQQTTPFVRDLSPLLFKRVVALFQCHNPLSHIILRLLPYLLQFVQPNVAVGDVHVCIEQVTEHSVVIHSQYTRCVRLSVI